MGLLPNEAKNKAYRIKHLSRDSMPASKEDTAKLGLRVMLGETKATSTKYGYLYAIEWWMAYIGFPSSSPTISTSRPPTPSSTRSRGDPTRSRTWGTGNGNGATINGVTLRLNPLTSRWEIVTNDGTTVLGDSPWMMIVLQK